MEADHGLSAAFFALRCAKDVSSKKVFLSYLLREGGSRALGSCLAPESVRYVSLVKIGVDILDQLPGPLASKYEGLVEKPASILENLVISLEIPDRKAHLRLLSRAGWRARGSPFTPTRRAAATRPPADRRTRRTPRAAAQKMGAEAFPFSTAPARTRASGMRTSTRSPSHSAVRVHLGSVALHRGGCPQLHSGGHEALHLLSESRRGGGGEDRTRHPGRPREN